MEKKDPSSSSGTGSSSSSAFFSSSAPHDTQTTARCEPTASARRSHIRPAAAAGILGGLLLISTIGTSMTYYDGSSRTYIESPSISGISASSAMELGDPIYFASGKDTVLTLPVTKLVPDLSLGSSTVSVDVEVLSKAGQLVEETGDSYTETQWITVPDMDFYTDSVYVSTILYDVQPEDIISVTTTPEGESYTEELGDYLWSLDLNDPASLDDATLRKLLSRSHEFARYDIEVTDDGVDEQSGVVVAKVTKPDASSLVDGQYYTQDNQITGSCNILFKKDGEVVFADVYYYPNETAARDSFAFAYTAPYDLPEYDSVEIVDLR